MIRCIEGVFKRSKNKQKMYLESKDLNEEVLWNTFYLYKTGVEYGTDVEHISEAFNDVEFFLPKEFLLNTYCVKHADKENIYDL